MKAPTAFDYDQITLVPRVASTLSHRSEAKPEIQVGPALLQIPLLGSPMPDVCGMEMCKSLQKAGGLGILHRFQPVAEQVREWKSAQGGGAAIGVTGDWQERFEALYTAGCRIFCLDTANGAHSQVKVGVSWLHEQAKDLFLIAGNVASVEAFCWLEDLGVQAIRVGIAGGSVCETKTETGVYAPTPYAVWEVAQKRKSALIIGDSGVRTPADFCKLLALGADLVMVGSALAGAREAPGRVLKIDGKKFKIMRGAASFSVQMDAGKVDPEYVEGDETIVPYKGAVADVVARYTAGLRSSMSYMDSRTLEEYRKNVDFLFLS